ncbi:hypothetical protein [Nocardia sp. CA-119907]|uniref:hypothetical protein n=1 Tax=Nocardia sp. CA-119907 TaxID=3239973 RepID=UPI003D977ECC
MSMRPAPPPARSSRTRPHRPRTASAALPGMGHLVPDSGASFDYLLEEFFRRADEDAK